jgi:hypothetical protein
MLQKLETESGLPSLDAVYQEIYEMNTEPGSFARQAVDRAFKWMLCAHNSITFTLKVLAEVRRFGPKTTKSSTPWTKRSTKNSY